MISPLQQFIAQFCSKCSDYKDACHDNTESGKRRMALCIQLYCSTPPDVNQILREATEALRMTETTAEATLEEAEK